MYVKEKKTSSLAADHSLCGDVSLWFSGKH
jgi:hypothetical protein